MGGRRRDWLLYQFMKANYALAYCDYQIGEGWKDTALTHPQFVALVTFRSARDELDFNWALLRLMVRAPRRVYRTRWEWVRGLICARRVRLQREINGLGVAEPTRVGLLKAR